MERQIQLGNATYQIHRIYAGNKTVSELLLELAANRFQMNRTAALKVKEADAKAEGPQ